MENDVFCDGVSELNMYHAYQVYMSTEARVIRNQSYNVLNCHMEPIPLRELLVWCN